MADSKQSPKQRTQPRGKDAKGNPAEPIEIPVPKRTQFDRLVKKAANRSKSGE